MLKTLLPFAALALVAQAPPAPSRPMPGMPPHGGPMAAAPDATEPQASQPIATMGKRVIRYGDFTAWLKVMMGSRADQVRKVPASRTQLMKQYLDLQVLAAKGQKDNLQATKEFQATQAALKQQAYARVLMDEDRPGSVGQKLRQQAENPSEEEMLAYFKANADRYAQPEKFTARHILVSLKGTPGAGDKGLSDADAKARLAKIQEELKAGKKFEDLAKEFSDDPGSKNNGGLYKDIPFGRFAAEFEEAVRKQEIGKVGEPVKTTFGYHLIEVESRTPKQAAEFDKVKETVRRQMIPERREKLQKEFLDQARKEVGYKENPLPAPAPKPPAQMPPPPPAHPVPPTHPAPPAPPVPPAPKAP